MGKKIVSFTKRPSDVTSSTMFFSKIIHLVCWNHFMFLPDEGPMFETLDFTICVSTTPAILYFDLLEDKWHNNSNIQKFSKVRGELSSNKDLLLRGQRIVLPKQIRHKTLMLADESYRGMVLTKPLRQKVCKVAKIGFRSWRPYQNLFTLPICHDTNCTGNPSIIRRRVLTHPPWPLRPIPNEWMHLSFRRCLFALARI